MVHPLKGRGGRTFPQNSNFANQYHVSIKWHLESAIRCASKAAYLSMLRLRNNLMAEKFAGSGTIASLIIAHTDYTKLNRLKKTDPEAFYYWYKAIELRVDK